MSKDWTGGYRSVVGCLGASSHSTSEREENDFYATDPIAAEWLVNLENLDNNIWECACGQGHLAKVFEAHGYNVKATDLIDRGYGEGGVDFLQCDEKFDGDIITNPPYKYAEQFIQHALTLIPNGKKVCMFLKVQFLEGKGRKALYAIYPPHYIYVSSSRIACIKNGVEVCNAIQAYAWYIWEKGYKGDTIIKWFN